MTTDVRRKDVVINIGMNSFNYTTPFSDVSDSAGADPGFRERGADKYIHNWREGTGGGVPPPVTARGSGGALIALPVGSGTKPQPLFSFQLRLFSMKFTVISNTFPSRDRDIRITRACMDSDEKTVHSSQCYGSYWLSN